MQTIQKSLEQSIKKSVADIMKRAENDGLNEEIIENILNAYFLGTKPKKTREPTAYNLFVKAQSALPEFKGMPFAKRNSIISKKWKVEKEEHPELESKKAKNAKKIEESTDSDSNKSEEEVEKPAKTNKGRTRCSQSGCRKLRELDAEGNQLDNCKGCGNE